jgi:hypothetical protein
LAFLFCYFQLDPIIFAIFDTTPHSALSGKDVPSEKRVVYTLSRKKIIDGDKSSKN